MSNPKVRIKELKPKKHFKKNFNETINKRTFIIEKFIKDLHCENLFDSIKSNSQNPLIQKKNELKKLKI